MTSAFIVQRKGLRFEPSRPLSFALVEGLGSAGDSRYHYAQRDGREMPMQPGDSGTMNARRTWRRCASASFAALGFVALATHAQELRIASADCSQPVHLIAKDVPLSTVLKDLSLSLHFVVVYQSETDPVVTTDTRSPATDLVRTLARNMNFSLEEATDAHCADGRRIARLSVLPDPAGGNRAVVASARPAWQTPEMERIARLGMRDYLTSHGMADQPMEELAVH
jgi:hypothetical protein